MLSFFFAFCNMELSVWHVMSENNANIKACLLYTSIYLNIIRKNILWLKILNIIWMPATS